jgi:dipeptidyl aminopeptidase/acylaminoacyl peptidase
MVRDLSAPDADAFSQVIDLGALDPNWVDWASDDRLVASLRFTVYEYGVPIGADEDAEPEYVPFTVGRLLSIPVSAPEQSVPLFYTSRGSNQFSRYQSYTHIVDPLFDDPDHILVAAWRRRDYSLWKVNLETGLPEIEAVGNDRTFAWYTNVDGEPVIRMDLSRQRDGVVVNARGGRRGNWRPIAQYRFDDIDDAPPDFVFAGNSEDPEIIYVLGRPDGSDRIGVYRYSLADYEYLERVGDHPSADVVGTMRLGREGRYAGFWAVSDRLHVEYVEPRLAAAYNAARAQIDERLDIIPIAMSGERLALLATGPELPGAYYVLNMETGEPTPVTNMHPDLSVTQLSAVETLRFPARDGLMLQAYYTRPATSGSEPPPMLLMPHGGPVARDVYGFDPTAQYFASLGYAVLQPNFRGSTGFGRAFMEAGYDEWGEAMQDDLTDSVRWAVERGLADSDRVCIVGWSYGGYAALMGALETPEQYVCSIAGAPVSDLVEQISHWDSRYESSDYLQAYVRELYGDPDRDRERLQSNSPISLVQGLQIPVLLQHGDRDTRVPVDHSRALSEAARASGVDLTYHEYEGEGHSFDDENQLLMMRRSAAFLAQHLPTPRNTSQMWNARKVEELQGANSGQAEAAVTDE